VPGALAICLGFAAPARPAGDPQADVEALPGQELAGRSLVELVVEGAITLAEESVLFHLGLEPGAAFDPAELDRCVRRLWDRGLLEDLVIDGERVDGGVRLVVRIVERPVVSSLEYRGLQRVRAPEIAQRLADERITVTEGSLLGRGELLRLEAAIEALYRERGFDLVDALAATEQRAGGRAAVVITVDEGQRLRVGEIRFEGNTVFADSRLRRAHKETRAGGWLRRLRGGGNFDRAALARDLERVRDVYRRAGYKDASLGEPRVELGGERGSSEVRITVPVEEGARWKLGGVGFRGNERVSDSRLLDLFERPSIGWLGSRFVDEGVERVRDLYGREGFMAARIETVLVERQGSTADVIVRIDEGERYRIGRIEVEGNSATRDRVIRRELAVQEGQTLDARALRRSLLRLGQLEFFEVDDEEPVLFELDERAKRVDLTLRGREADPPKLFFGGGYGRTHGLFGEIRYTSRNFRGRGETLSANLQAGADLRQVQLGYTVPWLLDRRQSLGAELFARDEVFDAGGGENLMRDLTGGRLRWGRRLGLFQTLTVGYTYQEALDSRSRLTGAGDTVLQALDREISSLELGYVLDRVDSRFQPTRGLRLSGTIESAGGDLGGDARFLRSRASLNLFQPFGGHRPRFVLGLNLEGGAVRPLGGGVLTFTDRFFRGGDSSVRGFEALAINPRDENGVPLLDGDGFLLGGDRFLEAGLELHLPINDVLRLVIFADAGNVWSESQSVDLSSLRHSAGLELRVTTPLFPYPLRFIWAENLSPLDGDRFDSLQFSFGAGF
jgi:outer membrane protein insertion porin family